MDDLVDFRETSFPSYKESWYDSDTLFLTVAATALQGTKWSTGYDAVTGHSCYGMGIGKETT